MNASAIKVVAAAVVLFAAQPALGQNSACGPSSNGEFDYEVILDEGVEIRWSMDTVAETISFEVVSAAAAWTSLGFSSDSMMIGSDAVIGLPDSVSVMEYDMTGKTVDDVIPFDLPEITGGTVSQSASGTTLTFTRPLTPSGKEPISSVPGDVTIFLYAYGDTNELAYHGPASRGAISLDLFCGDTDAGAATLPGTPAPSAVVTSLPIVTPDPSAIMTSAPVATRAPGATSTPAPGRGGEGSATPAPGAINMTLAPGRGGGGRGPDETLSPSATPSVTPTRIPIADARGMETATPTSSPTTLLATSKTTSPTAAATPAPVTTDNGGTLSSVAPTTDADAVGTSAPATVDEGADDQGDADGALRAGGAGWIAAVVTGFATLTVLAVLSM